MVAGDWELGLHVAPIGSLGYRGQTYPLYHGNRQSSQLPDTQILGSRRWSLLGPSFGGIPSAQSSQILGPACEDNFPCFFAN